MTEDMERMAEIVAARFDRDYDGGDAYDQLMDEFPDADADKIRKAVEAARSMVMAMDLGDDTEKRAPKVRNAFLHAMGVEDPLPKLMRTAEGFGLDDWIRCEENPYEGQVEITPIASLDLADLHFALHYLENRIVPTAPADQLASMPFAQWIKNTGSSLDLSDPDASALMNACLFSLITNRPTRFPAFPYPQFTAALLWSYATRGWFVWTPDATFLMPGREAKRSHRRREVEE